MSVLREGHLKTLDTCNVLKLFPFKDSAVLGFTKSIQNIQFFDVDDLTSVLIMKPGSEVYFRGILDVYCVYGEAEVHGYTLLPKEKKDFTRIFSLNGEAAYSIVSLGQKALSHPFDSLEIGIPGHLVDSFQALLDDDSSILLIKCYEDPPVKFISENMCLDLLPNLKKFKGKSPFSKTEELLNCAIDIPLGDRIHPKITFSSQLKELGNTLDKVQSPRIMICGGKNVGKSTIARYLVNKMLSSSKFVIYIDFDIGQPEFTVPGSVSVVLVKKPLLGPSYTHLQTPLKSIFLGFVNPNDCIPSFFKAIHYISEFCHNQIDLNSYPWIINTMGYTKGFGEVIILEIIKVFNLSTIVQLESLQHLKVNFASKLTHDYVRSKCDLLNEVDLKYDLQFMTSRSDNYLKHPISNISPKVSRELLVLFYIAKALSITDEFYKFSYKYRNVVSIRKNYVTLKSLLPLTNILDVVSGRELVALCSSLGELSLDLCHGFGVILEGSDDEMLQVITPLKQTEVNDVSVIVRGELGLSESLLRTYFSDTNKKPETRVFLDPKPLSPFHAYLFQSNP